MAIRTPRGFARNIPYYREICEGVRPHVSDLPLTAWTGLPHVRIDEYHHDPIVLDPGTIVGVGTGAAGLGGGYLLPVTLETGGAGVANATGLTIVGDATAASTWGLPGATATRINCGYVKPIGVIYQPVYSFILQSKYTNYKRNDNVGILTDYVISVPAVNSEEVAIHPGDVVMAGSGNWHGAGVTSTFSTNLLAGRYARYNSAALFANERIVGRCLKKLELGTLSGASGGELLADNITSSSFTISTAAAAEFADLAKVQTVPGLGLSGSGTSGIPAYLLGARCGSDGKFYALTLLIRL